MKLIDDRGNLFGAVNIIDALVVLLVVAVAGAGVAFVVGGEDTTQSSSQPEPTPELSHTAATLEITGVQPYVADALSVGPVDANGIVAVENKSVSATTVVTEDEAGNLYERAHPQKRTVTLQVTLETTTNGNETMYGENPLEIGRTASFDFGNVSVKGTVTELGESA